MNVEDYLLGKIQLSAQESESLLYRAPELLRRKQQHPGDAAKMFEKAATAKPAAAAAAASTPSSSSANNVVSAAMLQKSDVYRLIEIKCHADFPVV